MAQTDLFTGVVADRTFIITGDMSLDKLAVRCRTTVSGTIEGNLARLGDLVSSPITLSESVSPSIIAEGFMKDIEIIAPTGCEIEIMATSKR